MRGGGGALGFLSVCNCDSITAWRALKLRAWEVVNLFLGRYHAICVCYLTACVSDGCVYADDVMTWR